MPTTVQMRVLPVGRGATLSIHQEGLLNGAARAAMKAHREEIIARLAAQL